VKRTGKCQCWIGKKLAADRQSQSQSYITTDSQSLSPGVEPNLGLLTRDIFLSFFFERFCLVIWGRPL
jgi:hypothetical protein